MTFLLGYSVLEARECSLLEDSDCAAEMLGIESSHNTTSSHVPAEDDHCDCSTLCGIDFIQVRTVYLNIQPHSYFLPFRIHPTIFNGRSPGPDYRPPAV